MSEQGCWRHGWGDTTHLELERLNQAAVAQQHIELDGQVGESVVQRQAAAAQEAQRGAVRAQSAQRAQDLAEPVGLHRRVQQRRRRLLENGTGTEQGGARDGTRRGTEQGEGRNKAAVGVG